MPHLNPSNLQQSSSHSNYNCNCNSRASWPWVPCSGAAATQRSPTPKTCPWMHWASWTYGSPCWPQIQSMSPPSKVGSEVRGRQGTQSSGSGWARGAWHQVIAGQGGCSVSGSAGIQPCMSEQLLPSPDEDPHPQAWCLTLFWKWWAYYSSHCTLPALPGLWYDDGAPPSSSRQSHQGHSPGIAAGTWRHRAPPQGCGSWELPQPDHSQQHLVTWIWLLPCDGTSAAPAHKAHLSSVLSLQQARSCPQIVEGNRNVAGSSQHQCNELLSKCRAALPETLISTGLGIYVLPCWIWLLCQAAFGYRTPIFLLKSHHYRQLFIYDPACVPGEEMSQPPSSWLKLSLPAPESEHLTRAAGDSGHVDTHPLTHSHQHCWHQSCCHFQMSRTTTRPSCIRGFAAAERVCVNNEKWVPGNVAGPRLGARREKQAFFMF